MAVQPIINTNFEIKNGLPKEVWVDKYSRKKFNGDYQSWSERIEEVIEGNFLLDTRRHTKKFYSEKDKTISLGKKGLIALSGRHLQHGDLDQASKTGELFTNCSTSMFSWIKFYLLMKGSGVGRSYDSDIHFVNWDYMPNTRFVLSETHPDYEPWIETLEEAQHKYDSEGEYVRWFHVEDSAEGWVKIVTILETASFHKNNKDHLFIFNLTPVRGKGVPIKGQQGRPSSGPVPLIRALYQMATIKGAGYKPWKQALFIDHYLSACVAVGGVRRSARIATKYWKDRDIFDFIDVKRGGWLYTANNSIMVDEEFWKEALDPRPSHGRRVFEAAVSAAYYDNTGEPAFINVDKLIWNGNKLDQITPETYMSERYIKEFNGIHVRTHEMIAYVLSKVKSKKYPFLINPCGEIVLAAFGGYCIVGDLCMSNGDSQDEIIEGVKMMSRILVRTNMMDFLYKGEVNRTNRIGNSLIGIHECAAKLFNYNFYDILDEEKSQDWWQFIYRMSIAAEESAEELSMELGLERPHTSNCLKPAGTVAKVFDVTEAANLPSLPFLLRWIQFSNDHPLLEDYKKRGYPVKDISKSEIRIDNKTKEPYTVKGYPNTSIVGFPKKQPIADLLGDRVVCAGDVSIEDHYKWLTLLEKYWLRDNRNNQISYTLKYNPDTTSYNDFRKAILENQSKVRCCSFLPQINNTAYIYTPEERITKVEYDDYVARIDLAERESIDEASLDCASGSCGIDFSRNASIAEEALIAAE